MLMIEAFIRPNKLEAVRGALTAIGVVGMSAFECRGYGKQLGQSERFAGARSEQGFVPKIMLRVCVNGEDKEKTIQAILQAAKSPGTGMVGDGKIFVYPVAEVIRIRTGETNESAV